MQEWKEGGGEKKPATHNPSDLTKSELTKVIFIFF